jgi:ubiquinone biosynthesis protein
LLRPIRHVIRGIRVIRVLMRHQALFFVELLPVSPPVRRLARPWTGGRATRRPGQRLADALVELGPSFVKLGQTLAVRPDLMGSQVARDLARLQDRLEPFPAEQALALIERELEAPVERVFARFDRVPVAAASVAQVHFAELPDGREVAVKVLRPGIEAKIEAELGFFLWLAEAVEYLFPHLRRLRPVETVQVHALWTRRELDLRLEAAAAAEFALNCAEDEGFRVPYVDWERTSRRVLTLERISGTPSDQRARLIEQGLDPVRILDRAAVVFFNQVFRDGFFHADMHPGNTFIEPDGTIVPVDFGIMGRLDLDTRKYLAEILIGFLDRDYRRVADVFVRAGYVPIDEDRDAFAQAARAIGEPILGKPLADISIGRLFGQILTVAEQFHMQQQPHLLLLQKTMVVAEGVGRALDPTVNIWQTAQPLVAGWIARHLGPHAKAMELAQDVYDAARRAPVVLRRLEQTLVRMERQQMVLKDRAPIWLFLALAAFLLGWTIR